MTPPYSEEERAAILACLSIEDDPRRRQKLLAEIERAAERYGVVSAAREGDVDMAQRWAAIARSAQELQSLLEGIGEKLDYRLRFFPSALLALRIDATLNAEQVEKYGEFAHAKRLAQNPRRAHQPKQDAKISSSLFFETVFLVWLKSGGSLAVSAKDGRVYGPLVRYLNAVAAPVLQSATPAASSIPALVRSYAERLSPDAGREMREAFVEECSDEEEGIIIPF